MNNKDLNYLKVHYGERFAKLCRELFPTILEHPGLLKKVITENFDNSSTLYEDILDEKDIFQNYIYKHSGIKPLNYKIGIENSKKSPYELFDEAGYKLYPECKTYDDVYSFIKYYAEGEELCTFLNPDLRLSTNRIWFAVKKNVKQIKRENFPNPRRQDEYGTSVISIQFTKSNTPTLSIKNRYNHGTNFEVSNPDATFGNDLDNIIPGLYKAFTDEFKIKRINAVESEILPEDYRLANNGKYYKEICGFYGWSYCENNHVITPERDVIDYDPSEYLVFEYFVLNLKNKTIDTMEGEDGFIDSIGKIKNIKIEYDENKNKKVIITPQNVPENIKGSDAEIILVLDKANHLIGYKNNIVTSIDKSFLWHNRTLQKIEIKNVKTVAAGFLRHNNDLKELNAPKLTTIGRRSLCFNNMLNKINAPNLTSVGDFVLIHNKYFQNLMKTKE